MSRRKFTLEFRTEAAYRVIDSGRSVPEWPASSRSGSTASVDGCARNVGGLRQRT